MNDLTWQFWVYILGVLFRKCNTNWLYLGSQLPCQIFRRSPFNNAYYTYYILYIWYIRMSSQIKFSNCHCLAMMRQVSFWHVRRWPLWLLESRRTKRRSRQGDGQLEAQVNFSWSHNVRGILMCLWLGKGEEKSLVFCHLAFCFPHHQDEHRVIGWDGEGARGRDDRQHWQ